MLPSAPIELHASERNIRRDGETLSLPPKVLRLLLFLVERPGALLTREVLLAKVWPDVTVSGDALRYTLRQVRMALGDTSSEPHFVETVPRRGWRFIGEAENSAPGVWSLFPEPLDPKASVRLKARSLVGREEELRALSRGLESARGGAPRLIALEGEAGIGKTSAVEFFLDNLGADSDLVVARGQCVEHHGSSEAYLPIFDAIDDLCRGLGRDFVAGLLRRTAPLWLAQIPSLTDPEERRTLQLQTQGASPGRMIREITHAFEVLAEERTVILWIDDLHWCDSPSLDWLAHLIRRPSGSKILVIGCHRPAQAQVGSLAAFIRDLSLQECCEERALELLDERAIARYLDQRLKPSQSANGRAALQDLLVRRTEGNPLFMASIMNDLLDRGVLSSSEEGWELKGSLDEGLATPVTVRNLLRQEVERIDPRHREILEMASVAGMEFSAAALSKDPTSLEAVEECCEDLSGQGRLLVSRGIEEWPDGTLASRFAFSHALHREAFEGALSPGRRSRLHLEVGLRKEFSFQGREEQIAVELAHHFDEGNDPSRAVTYYAKAADEAAQRMANAESIALFRRGLQLLQNVPPSPERTIQELMLRLPVNVPLASVESYAAPQIEENLHAIEALGVLSEENPAFSSVLLGLWSLNLVRGDMHRTAEVGRRVLEMGERSSDALLLLQGHRAFGHACFFRGDLLESCQQLDAGLAAYPVDQHARLDYSTGDDPVVLSFAYRSWARWFRGLPSQALEDTNLAIQWGHRLEHPPSLALGLAYRAVLQLLRRDFAAAAEAAGTLDAFAVEHELALWKALAQLVRGFALQGQGSAEIALQEFDRGIEAWKDLGAQLGLPYFLCLRGELAAKAGQLEQGIAAAAEARASMDQTGQIAFASELRRIDGLLAAQSDELALARTAFQESVEASRRQGALAIRLRATLSWAEAEHRLAGAPSSDCLAEMRTAHESFREGRDDADLCAASGWLRE